MRSTRGCREPIRTFRSRGTRTMPFVTARAPKRRGRYGVRYRIALRPASWCCIRKDEDRLLQGCEPPWRLSEPVVRLSRVYIPGEESVGKGTLAICVLPARRQSEGVDVHQPNSSALGASSSQRQVPAGPGRDVQPVHSRLDQLLQPLLQDAVASDPEED